MTEEQAMAETQRRMKELAARSPQRCGVSIFAEAYLEVVKDVPRLEVEHGKVGVHNCDECPEAIWVDDKGQWVTTFFRKAAA